MLPHYLRQWFGPSDPAMEEALHDMPVYREFAKLDGVHNRLLDESTILRFRHLLEKHELTTDILRIVNDLLAYKGLLLQSGTAVDADSGLIRSVEGTAANVNDVTQANKLLDGE